MVGRVKALRSGTAKKPSRSTRADFQFPVGRVARNLKSRKYNERPKAGAPVYVVDVIEYLLSKVLELDRNAARDNKKTHIVPHYIQLAIMNNEELSKHLGYVIIASGGVKPYIRDSLLHK